MKCKCGRKAVYLRKYEGTLLCERCFKRSIESKIKRTIRKHSMVRKGDVVALAMSGGKDSSLSAYMIHKVFGKWPEVRIFAFSVDEGVRPYRTDNVKRAREFCRKLGIEHHVFSFEDEFGKTSDQVARALAKNPQGDKGSVGEVCTYCGVGRRYLMNKKAREMGATRIALGHNLDDEAQAAIMNYVRGDLARAGRMAPVTDWSTEMEGGEGFVPRIKPLREIPERETALFSQLMGWDILEGHCPHAGGVRFDIREFVNSMEDKYPGIKFSILETFDKLNPCIRKVASRQYGSKGKSRIRKCSKCGEPSSRETCKTCELWRS
jgi:uncharacterized protein (TIGR00269 family)